MPTWFALSFYLVAAWGLIVAVFTEPIRKWALSLWWVRAFDPENWWLKTNKRTRWLGIGVAAVGILNGTLGLTEVMG